MPKQVTIDRDTLMMLMLSAFVMDLEQSEYDITEECTEILDWIGAHGELITKRSHEDDFVEVLKESYAVVRDSFEESA